MNQSSLNNPINEIFTQFTNNLRSDLGLKSIDWPNDRILHYVIPPLLLELHAYRQHDKLRGNTPEQRFDEFQRISSDLEFLEQFKCENRDMAGIKQNGILGRLLRDSWLVFAEHLV